jgi:hypothetical protein
MTSLCRGRAIAYASSAIGFGSCNTRMSVRERFSNGITAGASHTEPTRKSAAALVTGTPLTTS